MDIYLIIIWICTFAGWLFYKKIKGIYDELDSMKIPYDGAFKSYKDFYDILMMKRMFQYYVAEQYDRFKGQQ